MGEGMDVVARIRVRRCNQNLVGPIACTAPCAVIVRERKGEQSKINEEESWGVDRIRVQ